MHEHSLSTPKDLTQGHPFLTVLKFSVPLMIGDFCQQLYNAVDSIVVGKTVGKEALAALGVAGPIMSIVIFLLVGIAMGAGVVMSQYYGAGENDKVRRVMSTALLLGLIFTGLLSVASIGLSKPFLRLLQTPAEILDDTDVYLKIVFAGAIFNYLYNFYCFSIRAIGNSFVPLIFLLVAVGVNAALDALFVIVLQMGVAGAAIATVIAQLLSAVLCIVYTHRKIPLLKLKPKDLVFDRKYFAQVSSYSLMMALQQVFIYIGRIAVQGLVNTYDVDAVAGVNSATRLDALIQTPMRGYTNALTTFCAQNYGARKFDRIRKGYIGSWIGVGVYTLASSLIGILAAKPLVALFVDHAEQRVIAVGAQYVTAMAFNYFGMCVIVQSQALMKGVGMLKAFFFSTAISIAFRIGLSYLFDALWGLEGMYWAVPVSWAVGSLYGLILCAFILRKKLNGSTLADVALTSDS